MSNEWEKVEANITPAWNYKTEDGNFSLKEGDELTGIYTGKKEGVGAHNSIIYEFKVGEETMGVWGSAVLDTRFSNLTEGMEVKIVYKGKTKSKKSGMEYHDFDVFKREVVKEDVPIVDEEADMDEINKML